jgi:hypothetical protein
MALVWEPEAYPELRRMHLLRAAVNRPPNKRTCYLDKCARYIARASS